MHPLHIKAYLNREADFDHDELYVPKHLSSINIPYLWKPYEKFFNDHTIWREVSTRLDLLL